MRKHYIAVDWSQRNMAIARMSDSSSKVHVIDVPSSVKELQLYLSRLQGEKILTFEESNPSQWLYTELRDFVDKLVVCDPYRNRLLSDGPKTDKIDATKLCQLLKADLLKGVFHSGDQFILLRRLVSGYTDVVKSGVRLLNQRTAIFRSNGTTAKGENPPHAIDQFVLEGLNVGIERYSEEKKRYEKKFKETAKQYANVRLLTSLPGIAEINAVKILAIVVDPRRFPSSGHFLSYCGLIRLDKISGGKSYGFRKPRYCRALKAVFKNAALGAIKDEKHPALKEYYLYLMAQKQYSESQARNAVARRLAILTLGILKSGEKFESSRRKQNVTVQP